MVDSSIVNHYNHYWIDMWKIDLMQYHSLVNVEQRDGQTLIFCTVRGKWLKYQQEELVRQLIIQYLITEQNIRKLSIVVEKSTGLKGQDRIDIAVLNRGGKPFMLIECKTWTERVNQSVLNQISRYNNQLKYPYCWVSTGKGNFLFSFDKSKNKYAQILDFPDGYS